MKERTLAFLALPPMCPTPGGSRALRLGVALAMALGFAVVRGAAAEPQVPEQGDSVRVIVLEDRVLRGRFVVADSTSLTVAPEPGQAPRTLLRPSVLGIEMLEIRTHAVRGGLLGFAVGGTIGLVYAGEIAEQEAINPLTGFVTGAVLGTAAGVVLGHRAKHSRWEPAALPWPRAGPAIESTPGAEPPSSAPVTERAPQDGSVVRPGDRVRFTLLASSPVEGQSGRTLETGTQLGGQLLFVTADTIAWHDREADEPRMLARTSLGEFEKGTARGTRALRGAVTGLVVGAGAGFLLGLAAKDGVDEYPFETVFALYGGAAGLGVGAFIGSQQRDIHWDPASLPQGSSGVPTLVLSASSAAGAPPPPRPGDRVRVVSASQGTQEGRLHAYDAQSLELDDDLDSWPRPSLSRSSITSIEVQRPHDRARLGAALGFVVGGVTARSIHADMSTSEDFTDVPIGSLLLGGIAGAMAGWVIGHTFKVDRWHEASLP